MIKLFLFILIGFLWGVFFALKVLYKYPEDVNLDSWDETNIKKFARIYMDGTACDGCPFESELICTPTKDYENFCAHRIMEVMENGN